MMFCLVVLVVLDVKFDVMEQQQVEQPWGAYL